MRVAVLGGTGRTGREVVSLALEAGYGVKVLARNPDAVPPQPGVEVVAGSALDGGRVMALLVGCEAAVIALGNVKGGPVDVCSRATELVIQAAAKVGLKRVVVVSSLGVGESRDEVPWAFRLIADLFLKPVFVDKERQEALVRGSDLEWVVLRPTGLVDGPPTDPLWSGSGAMRQQLPAGAKVRGTVSRRSVAQIAVDALGEAVAPGQTLWITG